MDYPGRSDSGHVSGDEHLVEVTLDVHDDSIVLQTVSPANATTTQEDAEMMLVEADGLDRRSFARISSFELSASHRLKQFSQAYARVKHLSQELK